jgi:hypothetical protein
MSWGIVVVMALALDALGIPGQTYLVAITGIVRDGSRAIVPSLHPVATNAHPRFPPRCAAGG